MRRRPGFVPFIVILPPLVLAGGLLLWLYANVRHTLNHVPHVLQSQLAAYLGREVRIGRIETDLWNGVTVHDIAIARGKRLRDGALLRVKRARLHYSLEAILYRRQPPLETLRKVEIDEPWIFISRDARGRLNLQDLVKPGPKRAGPAQRFLALVLVRGGTVVFEDHQVPGGRTMTHHLTGIEARIDARADPLYAASVSFRGDAGRLRDLNLLATVNVKQKNASVSARVRGVNIPAWLAYKPASVRLPADIRGGNVDVDATALVMGGKLQDYHAQVALRDGAFTMKQLGEPISRLSARLDVSPNAVMADDVRVRAGNLDLAGSATVVDFKNPQLRGRLSVTNVQEADVRALVGKLPALPDVRLGRVDNVEVALSGSLQDPAVHFRANVSSISRPEATVSGIQIEAHLLGRKRVVVDEFSGQVAGGLVTATGSVDLSGKEPRYFARGTVRDVHLEALNLGKQAGDISPTGTVSVDFEASGEGAEPEVHARIDLADLTAKGGWRADSLQGDVTYRGKEKKIELSRLQLRAPEGLVTAYGSVDLKGPVQVQVAATGIDLATLGRRFGMQPLRGNVHVRGEVKGTITDPSFAGEVAAYDVGWGEDAVQMIRGNLTASLNEIRFDECRAFMPPIMVGNAAVSVVDVRAGSDAELTATAAVLGIDLGLIAKRLKLEGDWGGKVDVEELEVSGPLSDLRLTAGVTAEHLRIPGTGVGYISGRLSAGLDGSVEVAKEGALTIRGDADPSNEASELRVWGTVSAKRDLDLHVATAEGSVLRVEDYYAPPPEVVRVRSELIVDDLRVTGPATNPRVHSDRPECVDVRGLEINGIPFGLGYAVFEAGKDRVVIHDAKIRGKEEPGKPAAGTAATAAAEGTPAVAGTDGAPGATAVASADAGEAGAADDPELELYELSGEVFPHMDLTAVVNGVPIPKLLKLARQPMPAPPLNVGGKIRALIRVREGKPRPQVRLENVAVSHAQVGPQRFSTLQAKGIALEADSFILTELSLAVPEGGTLTASGKASLAERGQISFDLKGRGINLAMADPFLPPQAAEEGKEPLTIGGQCTEVNATLAGTIDRPVLDGEIWLQRPRYGKSGLDNVYARFGYRDNLATVSDILVERGIYRVTGDARLPVDWEKKAIAKSLPMSAHFALAEQSLGGLAELSPRVVESKGSFSARFDVGGTAANPDLDGLVKVHADEIVLGSQEKGKEPKEALWIEGLDGVIRFKGDRIVVEQLTLASETNPRRMPLARKERLKVRRRPMNPRALAVSGEILLKQFALDEFNLRVAANDYRVDADNLSGGMQEKIGLTLRGQGSVRGRLPSPLIDGDFGLHATVVDVSAYKPAEDAPPPKPFPVSPRFNLHVATAGSAQVLAPRTKAFVQVDTTLRGELNAMKLGGTVRSTDGSVNLPTAHFRIKEANIEFRMDAPEPFSATGKAVLTTRLRGSESPGRPPKTYNVTATANIQFPAPPAENPGEEPKPYTMEMAANPYMDEEAIWGLLLRQDVLERILAQQGNFEEMVKQEATQYLATALQPHIIEPIERAIADKLGLSEFSIAASLEEPVEVKVGKYLVEGLRVSYTRAVSARETRFTFKVDYEVIDKVSVSWSTDQQRRQTFGLEAGLRF